MINQSSSDRSSSDLPRPSDFATTDNHVFTGVAITLAVAAVVYLMAYTAVAYAYDRVVRR